MNPWFILLYQPLFNALFLFYKLFGNLGLAIIGLTLAIRTLTIPLTRPSLETAKRMKELQPKIEKLKKKYKKDKSAFAKAQLSLYQKHGVNPAAGCLPQIIQIVILIALFQAFSQVLSANGEIAKKINEVLYPFLQIPKDFILKTSFLYLDLSKPDLIRLPFRVIFFDKIPGFFLLAAAATQYFSSKLMMPQAKISEAVSQKTPQKTDDFASAMQEQMLYMMPLMTIFIGFTFPSGLVLYWLTFSLFMLGEQLVIKKRKTSSIPGLACPPASEFARRQSRAGA